MGKIKRKYSTSGGTKKMRSAQRRIKFLERKIKRWDKNRSAGKQVSKNNKTTSRGKGWDTAGMKKHIQFLSGIS